MNKYILSFTLLLFLTTQTKAQNSVSGPCVTNATSGPDTSVCQSNIVQLYASGGTQFSWAPSSSVDSPNVADPIAFPFSTTTYTVTVTDSGCTPATATVTIIILPSPPVPILTQTGCDSISCRKDTSYATYQWYDGNLPVPGATDSFLYAPQPGNFNLQVCNVQGCCIAVGISGYPCTEGIINFINEKAIVVYPSPANNEIMIHTLAPHNNQAVRVSVMNILGETMQEERTTWSNNLSINVKNLPAGIYLLQLKSESRSIVKKFVKG